MPDSQFPDPKVMVNVRNMKSQRKGYSWCLIHTIVYWARLASQYFTSTHTHRPVQEVRHKMPTIALDIAGQNEAERRARRLLQVLGLPQLDIALFVEALNIDDTESNGMLALFGNSVHRMLLVDVARATCPQFSADIIQKPLFDFSASKVRRAHAALCRPIRPVNKQLPHLRAIYLDQFMFKFSLDQRRTTYNTDLERIDQTVAAIIGAVQLASGAQWHHHCLEVLSKLGLDAASSWKKVWDNGKIPFRETYGDQIWSEIEGIGKGVFFR